MIKTALTGFKEVKAALGKITAKIADSIGVAQQEVGLIGEEYAKNAAPFYTGQLVNNIFNRRVNQYAWEIVSKNPSSDKIPINVLFDTGQYPILIQPVRDPNSLFFMQKTAIFVEDEYSRRLKFIIESNLK